MPVHRFFLKDPLQSPTAVLTGPEFHHLKHVMRIRPGETIELVNGQGTVANAELTQIKDSEALFEIHKKTQSLPPSFEIILAQGLTKPSLLDWILEKGTELGATQFWLFPGDQSEKKSLSSHQLPRLEHLVISALKQSKRLYLPSILLKPPLHQWSKPDATLLFGSLSPAAKPLQSSYSSPLIIVIGPEKGLSPEERLFLETNLQATGISLHPNTLRAETAALCALSQLSYLYSLQA